MSDLLNLEEGRILVVEDTSENIQYLQKILKDTGYIVSVASNGNQALNIAVQGFDLILLDVMMPGMNGFDVCKELKKMPETKDIPVIFLTAINQRDDILQGLRLGAVDYITKPFQSEELLLRIRNHLELVRNRRLLVGYLDDLGKEKMKFEQAAITDSLTELYNHNYIIDRVSNEIAQANRQGTPLSAIMFDLDHFKKINDTFGHQIGDDVLVKVSSVLKARLREADTAGRYGGEEFVVVLPNTKCEQASMIGERIRESIVSLEWDIADLHVTISGGVYQRKDENTENLICEADRLLYLAKQKGRNRIISSK